MGDPLSKPARSALMAKVRGVGNQSTEVWVEKVLREEQISGWRKHLKTVPGRPDFFFRTSRLAVFVDGCFWHACPVCGRNMPTNRAEFWNEKIDGNRRRDARVRRRLRAEGYHVMRIWEHELRRGSWVRRLRWMIEKHRISK